MTSQQTATADSSSELCVPTYNHLLHLVHLHFSHKGNTGTFALTKFRDKNGMRGLVDFSQGTTQTQPRPEYTHTYNQLLLENNQRGLLNLRLGDLPFAHDLYEVYQRPISLLQIHPPLKSTVETAIVATTGISIQIQDIALDYAEAYGSAYALPALQITASVQLGNRTLQLVIPQKMLTAHFPTQQVFHSREQMDLVPPIVEMVHAAITAQLLTDAAFLERMPTPFLDLFERSSARTARFLDTPVGTGLQWAEGPQKGEPLPNFLPAALHSLQLLYHEQLCAQLQC